MKCGSDNGQVLKIAIELVIGSDGSSWLVFLDYGVVLYIEQSSATERLAVRKVND